MQQKDCMWSKNRKKQKLSNVITQYNKTYIWIIFLFKQIVKEIYNKGLQIPLYGMGPLMWLFFNDLFSLSMCEKPKKNETQVGSQMWEDDNGDDDNDRGE